MNEELHEKRILVTAPSTDQETVTTTSYPDAVGYTYLLRYDEKHDRLVVDVDVTRYRPTV